MLDHSEEKKRKDGQAVLKKQRDLMQKRTRCRAYTIEKIEKNANMRTSRTRCKRDLKRPNTTTKIRRSILLLMFQN